MLDPTSAGKDSIYPALLTAAAGVFTTLLTLFVGWLRNKSADARRSTAIDEASKRVQFLEAWYRTRAALTPNELEESRRVVLRELDAAMDSVEAFDVPNAQLAALQVRKAFILKLNWFRRWFLLYGASRPLVWLPRIFFYSSTIYTLIFTFIIIFTAVNYRVLLSVVDLGAVAVFFAVCLSMRWFAILVDRKKFVGK